MYVRLDLYRWFDVNLLTIVVAAVLVFDAILLAVYGLTQWSDSTWAERALQVSGPLVLLLAVGFWLAPAKRVERADRSPQYRLPEIPPPIEFRRGGAGPLSDPGTGLPDLPNLRDLPLPGGLPGLPKIDLPDLNDPRSLPPRGTIEVASTAPPTTSAYWNTWFEYLDDPAPRVLTAGNTYTFTADISPFEYIKLRKLETLQSTTADPQLKVALADPKISQITFQVRPILAEGAGLSFASLEQSNTIPMPTILERIRYPDLSQANRYVAGTASLRDLSEKASAGSVRFKVRTDKAGCAAVVLAVFGEDGLVPLDHLVRRVAIIAKPGETPPPCDTEISGGHQQQYGGLGNLLRVSMELTSTGKSQRAAAAFHIFDSKAGSFVIFADGRPNLQKSIYAWQTDSLVDYVSTPGRLPLLIDKARDAATNGTKGSYAKAANELADFIFGGRGSGEDEANRAKAAFREIVVQSATRPVILVRVVSDIKQGQNRSVFVPLGILGANGKDADGKDAVLAQPITVIQPLPRERYDSSCVKDWTFGLPLRLETIERDLKWPPNTPGANSFHDLLGLKKYVSDPAPADGLPGQGFLLLAHNGNGNIWFDDQAERIIRQNVTRRFPSGSVGVFAACSLAPATYDPGFVQQFNEHGIDTLIASPFSVPAEYGIRLASEFPKAIASLQSSKPTISELFAETLKQTADAFKSSGGKYEEMGLEYVLLGNAGIRLCDLPAANPDTGGKQ